MGTAVTFLGIHALRHQLADHPLYGQLNTAQALQRFTEHHVFAVWDFMALVKSLQRDLTGLSLPWVPPEDREAARLINEIVLGEESDAHPQGGHVSHFELYLEAMKEIGANTAPIERAVASVRRGMTPDLALAMCGGPSAAVTFASHTVGLACHAPVHVRAAALFYGREDLIPPMFTGLVERLEKQGVPCKTLLYYLERHIEVDEGEHSRLAEKLVARLCEGSTEKWAEVQHTARDVLKARVTLWDGILDAIRSPTCETRRTADAGEGPLRRLPKLRTRTGFLQASPSQLLGQPGDNAGFNLGDSVEESDTVR